MIRRELSSAQQRRRPRGVHQSSYVTRHTKGMDRIGAPEGYGQDRVGGRRRDRRRVEIGGGAWTGWEEV